MSSYAEFLERKRHCGDDSGFDPVWVPDFLFPFQRELLGWACRKGRGAIFADCLGEEAVVHSPDGDRRMADAFAEGAPMRVYALDRDGRGPVRVAIASAPFVAGFDAYELQQRGLAAAADHAVDLDAIPDDREADARALRTAALASAELRGEPARYLYFSVDIPAGEAAFDAAMASA